MTMPPLTDRITTAFDQMRRARADGDPDREWSWMSMMDRLLDKYILGDR